MSKLLIVVTLLCASLSAQATSSCNAAAYDEHQSSEDSAVKSVNPVVQWNRTLLVIVRTPGAQPATVHATRSFAIMHAAIYDAVNAIDGTRKPYLVPLRRPRQQQRTKPWQNCIQNSRQPSMPNFSRRWRSFPSEERPRAST